MRPQTVKANNEKESLDVVLVIENIERRMASTIRGTQQESL